MIKQSESEFRQETNKTIDCERKNWSICDRNKRNKAKTIFFILTIIDTIEIVIERALHANQTCHLAVGSNEFIWLYH